MPPFNTLLLIVFLEGYIVLSTELLAIRLLIPFTGSGTDTVSIIIAAVLLPLALGYYAGGRFRPARRPGKAPHTLRRRLVTNLVVSAAILTPGLSYLFLDWGFGALQSATGLYNRIALTALYALVFLAYPVYLLGQTVPLLSNYFSRQRLSLVAGRMLFYSTLGSFMGAVFGTLVLMTFLGVHNTVIITMACIAALTVALSRRKLSAAPLFALFCLAVTFLLNSPMAMKGLNIVANNKYSTVQVVDYDDQGMRAFILNRSFASLIYKYSDEPYAEYTRFIEENFLAPLRAGGGAPRKILILGAGGFTLGRSDTVNDYTFVDIDADLKEAAEKHFLQQPLPPNHRFVAMDARAFLMQDREKYDLIIIDLFRDPVSVPENLTTVEFFSETKNHVTDGGMIIGNYFASPTFRDAYSRNLDATLRAAYGSLGRQAVTPYDAWQRQDDWANIIYSYTHQPGAAAKVYTDDKSSAAFDRPANLIH